MVCGPIDTRIIGTGRPTDTTSSTSGATGYQSAVNEMGEAPEDGISQITSTSTAVESEAVGIVGKDAAIVDLTASRSEEPVFIKAESPPTSVRLRLSSRKQRIDHRASPYSPLSTSIVSKPPSSAISPVDGESSSQNAAQPTSSAPDPDFITDALRATGIIEASLSNPPQRTSEDERIAELQRDPYVLRFDESTVTCRLCNGRIKLYGRKHHIKAWVTHKQTFIHEIDDLDKAPPPLLPPPPPLEPVHPTPAPPPNPIRVRTKPAPRQSEKSRIEELKQDAQVAGFDSNSVTCGFCQRKLRTGGSHNLGAWHSHKVTCTIVNAVAPPAVRNRTTEAERIAELRADPKVLDFSSDRVTCALCGQTIKLSGPHYLTTWNRHKFACHNRDMVKSENVEDSASLLVQAQPPPGTASAPPGPVPYNPMPPPPDIKPVFNQLLLNPRPQPMQFRPILNYTLPPPWLHWSLLRSYASNRCPVDGKTPTERDPRSTSHIPTSATPSVAPASPSPITPSHEPLESQSKDPVDTPTASGSRTRPTPSPQKGAIPIAEPIKPPPWYSQSLIPISTSTPKAASPQSIQHTESDSTSNPRLTEDPDVTMANP
ncbi:hypothetical protein SISSUDRAFT_241718 [Sistotremastrum suecicum HHB10207 ss-3]|uniref:Uncharacterized protein n=1 Tax=Sistotremastrum suecicum HHB10207 ss-3 TaxID=1314776 RepID=A0A166A0J9_9AGAM|nr:hypothetical protein SISSUDRAFT_241718 [Sistotremastrum suecicum HHB10207 ss-3]